MKEALFMSGFTIHLAIPFVISGEGGPRNGGRGLRRDAQTPHRAFNFSPSCEVEIILISFLVQILAVRLINAYNLIDPVIAYF